MGSPSLTVLNNGLCGRTATLNWRVPEFRSCVKVEVDVLGSPSLTVLNNGLCGRTATLNWRVPEFRSCVKVEVDVLGSLALINVRFLWT